jgi:Fe-S oxidoreductase
MTAYKSEFLAQKYKGRLHPLHHYVFGFSDVSARLGSITPALTNFILNGPLTSPIIKAIVGVAKERKLPELASKPYRQARPKSDETANLPRSTVDRTSTPQAVVLWADTWNNYYHPQTLQAADRVLTQAGFRVQTTKSHICCGRALYDFGLLGPAKSYLIKVLEYVAPQIEAGLPFIFLEPSCASVFHNEALEFFKEGRLAVLAQKMSKQTWLLADWLAAKSPDWVTGRLKGASVVLHGHCHHKAVFGGPTNEIALLRKAGAAVQMINSTCCGMAGPFGFEADKIEVSKAIANLDLLPAVRAASATTVIVADGFSCREQIAQLSDREGVHFAELLDRSCGSGG